MVSKPFHASKSDELRVVSYHSFFSCVFGVPNGTRTTAQCSFRYKSSAFKRYSFAHRSFPSSSLGTQVSKLQLRTPLQERPAYPSSMEPELHADRFPSSSLGTSVRRWSLGTSPTGSHCVSHSENRILSWSASSSIFAIGLLYGLISLQPAQGHHTAHSVGLFWLRSSGRFHHHA